MCLIKTFASSLQIHRNTLIFIAYLTFSIVAQFIPSSHASALTPSQPLTPLLSYQPNAHSSRNLIFLNNPEFLWATHNICDLADEQIWSSNVSCSKSLFSLSVLKEGQYRAWWEHRNMMPFAIRSSLMITNSGHNDAILLFEGDAIETNSTRKGGSEFVQLFNGFAKTKSILIKPGEQILLGETSHKWIYPGHFFAGVSDFTVIRGHIKIDEIVFRRAPASHLISSADSQRTTWGVHESLVYKGISHSSEVVLTGAHFTIDDETPRGPRPVAYHPGEVNGTDFSTGFCDPESIPTCSGSALRKQSKALVSDSWVTHIGPDPRDPNPKRKRAIIDDLISLTLPGSTNQCPSEWPIEPTLASERCMRMSANYHWYLIDFENWRLPNWGNWGVHYHHPIRVTNRGLNARTIGLRVTADGKSPLAYRGTGVSATWKQAFLDPEKKYSGENQILIIRQIIPASSTLDLRGEFILSGPGAGTLEHHFEILE